MSISSRKGDPANVAALQKKFLKCLLSTGNAIVAAVYKNLQEQQQQQSQDSYSAIFNPGPDHHIAAISNYIFNAISGCLQKHLSQAYKDGKYWALKEIGLDKPAHDFTVEGSFNTSYSLIKAANVRLAAVLYEQGQLSKEDLKSVIEKAIINSFTNIALTETLRQKVAGAVETFKRNGIKKGVVQAEYRTAGDNHVCPRCEASERKVMSLDEIKALIPQHPRCRCWFQVLGKDDDGN